MQSVRRLRDPGKRERRPSAAAQRQRRAGVGHPGEDEHLRSVRDALRAAGFQASAVGIFGKRVGLDHALVEGDRVEIYRPLAIDPKEARRRRARKS